MNSNERHLEKRIKRLEADLSRYSMDAGSADQFRSEAQACRAALGFSKFSEAVSPAELVEAINKLKDV